VTAGYSGTPLVRKLGLRPDHRVALHGAPVNFRGSLEPLPDGIRWKSRLRAPLDCVVLFAPMAAALEAPLALAAAALTPAGMLWVAWPKQSSKVPTDLTENRVRERGLAAGLVDVKVCAISEVWSGLKFVRRLADR
jgi:hypothetical protein